MLTSAGVSAVDGNYSLRAGLFGEFADSLALRYGGYDSLYTGWVSKIMFQPHVGEQVLSNMAGKERSLEVLRNTSFRGAEKLRRGWRVTLEGADGLQKIHTRVLVDCTELGDVAAACGAAYDVGMEGTGVLQDLTYVITVREYPDDRTIPRPEGYDIDRYRNCCINPLNTVLETGQRLWSVDRMLSYGRLPGGDIMLNWPIEGNDFYADMVTASPEEREKLIHDAKQVALGYLYFIQTELGYNNIGIAEGEYPTEDGLPLIPYFRESRRIRGVQRFDIPDAEDPYSTGSYRDGIAVGDYPVDHHHFRHPDWKTFPNFFNNRILPFTIPMGCMIPESVEDLIVAEKSISVSNAVNGTTRLQPVVMELGQAAGALAALTASSGRKAREVKASEVQDILLSQGCMMMPFCDVTPDDPDFVAIQKTALRGILRGSGKSIGWANRMYFYPDAALAKEDIHDLPECINVADLSGMTRREAARVICEAL